MVERFNRCVGSEVLGITIYSHRDLKHMLRGLNSAYNTRRRRVLDGMTLDQIVAECLKVRRRLTNAKPHSKAGSGDLARTRLTAEATKEVSQPNKSITTCISLRSLYAVVGETIGVCSYNEPKNERTPATTRSSVPSSM